MLRSPLSLLTAAALSLCWSAAAHAQSACQGPGAVCLDADTFTPRVGATRFASLGGTEPLPAGEVALGLVGAYTSRPLSLRSASPLPNGTRFPAVDNQLTAHLLWAYGVTERLHAALITPFTLFQDGAGTQPITGGEKLRKQAMRDVRFGIGYALVPRADAPDAGYSTKPTYGLMARLDMTLPTGDRDAFSTGGTAVLTPSLAGDLRLGRWLLASELGVRLRPTRDVLGARQSSQIALGLGAAVDLLPRDVLSVFGEARALISTAQSRELWPRADGGYDVRHERSHAPAEWALGVRSAGFFGGDLALDASVGSGVSLGASDWGAPRLRVLFGVRYTPRLRDSDGDGVLDKYDRCPFVRGLVAEGSDAGFDGCVHEAPKPLDFVDPADAPSASEPSAQGTPPSAGEPSTQETAPSASEPDAPTNPPGARDPGAQDAAPGALK